MSGGSSGTLEEEGSEAQPWTRILPGCLLRGHSDQVWICVGERDCSYLALGRPKLFGECHMGLLSRCACLACPSQRSFHFPLGFLVSRLHREPPWHSCPAPCLGLMENIIRLHLCVCSQVRPMLHLLTACGMGPRLNELPKVGPN